MTHTRRIAQRPGVHAIAACAVALGLTASHAAASPIQVSGVTSGCFGEGCTDFQSSAEYDAFGLTFEGADPFSVFTDISGEASGIVLGTFERGNVRVEDWLDPVPFTLRVAFTMPTALGDHLFTAEIQGTAPGGGGPLDIDFVNDWQTVFYSDAYGSGSFDIAVLNDLDLTKNGNALVLGGIRNASYEAWNENEFSAAAVPEPASITLFGGGMLLLARRLRKRVRASDV